MSTDTAPVAQPKETAPESYRRKRDSSLPEASSRPTPAAEATRASATTPDAVEAAVTVISSPLAGSRPANAEPLNPQHFPLSEMPPTDSSPRSRTRPRRQ